MQIYEWICIDVVIRCYSGKKLKILVNRNDERLRIIEHRNSTILISLILLISIINILIPFFNLTYDNDRKIRLSLYILMESVLLLLFLLACKNLKQSSDHYGFKWIKVNKPFIFAISSLAVVKIVFVILELSLKILHHNIISIFIGGSGIIFIYEASILIWIKNYNDILQTNFDIFFLILKSRNYNSTEIFLPFMY